jgi:hypothetical protein
MLAGFPKSVTTVKLSRRRYRLTRDDGYTVEIERAVRGWRIVGTGRTAPTLRSEIYDLRHGYTAHDQLVADDARRLRTWETAMGMRGYAGSPAERADRAKKEVRS